LAASASDLSAQVRIGSVHTAAFSNSLISAETIGNLHLGSVTTANNGTAFGVSAHKISTANANLVPNGGNLAAGLAQLKTAATLSAYETAKKLTLGDFTIKLF
jgi:hypothetical protein